MSTFKINKGVVDNLESSLSGKSSTDLDNLSQTGEAHFANSALSNSPYTTNRILEIPQDIKLELVDGTLTLKAGSKVYVPNGFEEDGTTLKFDELVLSSDFSPTITPGASQTLLLYVRADGSTFDFRPISLTSSGSSDPGTNTTHYYNTATNKLICYFAAGGSAEDSFPIALFTTNSNSVVSSIDQVFNGFGYIGSTVFALPGVKVQIPDGRNEDGTYKSIFRTLESVSTLDIFTNNSKALLHLSDGVLVIGKCSVNANNDMWFDEETGYLVRKDGFDGQKSGVIIADILSSTKISSFTLHNVDSVVNSNASNFSQAGRSYLSGLGMPSDRYIDLTLLASESTYTAPANGWFFFIGSWSNANTYFQMRSVQKFYRVQTISVTGNGYHGLMLPITKGDSCMVAYAATPSNVTFRFIYAEGETNV